MHFHRLFKTPQKGANFLNGYLLKLLLGLAVCLFALEFLADNPAGNPKRQDASPKRSAAHVSLRIVLPRPPAPHLSSPAGVRVVRIPRREMLLASWYGEKFHGRPTASGEIYNMNRISVAHRTFPLGTMLRITRKEKSVIARVNDRGPFIPGRSLDLSRRAAELLGMIEEGVAPVMVEVLRTPKM